MFGRQAPKRRWEPWRPRQPQPPQPSTVAAAAAMATAATAATVAAAEVKTAEAAAESHRLTHRRNGRRLVISPSEILLAVVLRWNLAENCCVPHLAAYLWAEVLPLQLSSAAVSRPFQAASPSQAAGAQVPCCLQHE